MNSYKEVDKVGTVRWFHNDFHFLHRKGGPAVECDSYKSWYQNGKLHREDGPAIEFSNGDKVWFYEGKDLECSYQEEFERLIKLKAFW